MDVRLVFRNRTNREDAVYVITATTQDDVITVAGEWGKWNAFLKGSRLQQKVYYSGTTEICARDCVRRMRTMRYERGYIYQPEYSREEQAPVAPGRLVSSPFPRAVPAPEPPAAASVTPEDPPTPYPGIQTRAGALEF